MKIVLSHLTKTFPGRGRGNKKKEDVVAVNDFTFEIPDGKLVGLLGPSGCGKSTTLNLICGLQKPTEGQIFFDGEDVTQFTPQKRGVGMVFQNYALYPHLNVEQNIRFPLENFKGSEKLTKEQMRARVEEAANLVQLGDLLDRKPAELSGGQQQRVAIGRALITKPKLILADEPTGNLDVKNSQDVMDLLTKASRRYQQTILMITHNNNLTSSADRVLRVADGILTDLGGKRE